MKNVKTLAAIALTIGLSHAASAQLGNLVKRAAKETAVKEGSKALTGKGGVSDKVSAAAGASAKLDWKMYPMTAAITMETLLNNTEIYNHGNLRANFYMGTFVPNKTASGASVDPLYKNEGVMRAKLYANNQLLNEISYNEGDFFTEGKQVRFQTGITSGDTDIKQEGKYRLDFYAGDNLFYTFDFEVLKKVDTDPYASEGVLWYAKGPWEKMAFVTPQTTGNFIFGFYMMHTDFKPDPNNARKTTKSVNWFPELYKDGKLISVKAKNTAIVQKGEWKPFTTSIKLTGGKDFLKIAELADGNYTYKVNVEGETAPRSFNFAMKGGKIVHSDKQDRAKNKDPKTLVEGWNNYFWLERS